MLEEGNNETTITLTIGGSKIAYLIECLGIDVDHVDDGEDA